MVVLVNMRLNETFRGAFPRCSYTGCTPSPPSASSASCQHAPLAARSIHGPVPASTSRHLALEQIIGPLPPADPPIIKHRSGGAGQPARRWPSGLGGGHRCASVMASV